MAESWGLGDLSNLINRIGKPNKKDRFDKDSMPFVETPSAKVSLLEAEFDKVLAERYDERLNEEADWRLYTGFRNGQWDSEALSILKEQGRNPFQANIVSGKVDGLQGSIIKSWFDIGYESIDPRFDELARILKRMLLSDKELM